MLGSNLKLSACMVFYKLAEKFLILVGYEIITGKGRENTSTNYILSSHKLTVDDYYCVPKYHSTGENCLWMIEPLLISCKRFTDIIGSSEVN